MRLSLNIGYELIKISGETVGRSVGVQQADEGGTRGTGDFGPVHQRRLGRPQLQLRRHRQGVRHQEVS